MSHNTTSSERTASTKNTDTVGSFAEQLTYHRNKLELCDRTSDDFLSAMSDLLQFLRTYEDKHGYEAFEKSVDFHEQQKFFSQCLLSFAMAREELTYAELMEKTNVQFNKFEEIIGSRYLVRYSSMAETLELVDYSACKQYVMIGIGRVPASMLYLHDCTNVPELVGIDNFAQAVEKCQQFVDAFKINRMSVVLADGINYDYSSADIIYLGYFANPRDIVLERVLQTAKKSAQIILRDPYFTGTLFAKRLLPLVENRMKVRAEGKQMPWYLNQHLILTF